jgi:uncharacterized protein YjiS (DUF1127 family)
MDGSEVPHLAERACPGRTGRMARLRTSLAGGLVRLVEQVIAWHRRRREQRRLARLDDRSLRDIGIDRAAVEDESTVSFWRLR